jgi:regulator of sirC expression with transglutaminase-like and TPR domain
MSGMHFKPAAPSALEYFASLVKSDQQFPLLEAAISLSQIAYPTLVLLEALADVDRLLVRFHERLKNGQGESETLQDLNRFFYRDMGFGGNVNDYYDPDNSFIPRVLITRRGIPISLAVLWLEIASASGLQVHGIGFPGHFLVKAVSSDFEGGEVVIDPFTGVELSREALLECLGPLDNSSNWPMGIEQQAWLNRYLEPAAPREIIARMLRNLLSIYQAEEDTPRVHEVQRRLELVLRQP